MIWLSGSLLTRYGNRRQTYWAISSNTNPSSFQGEYDLWHSNSQPPHTRNSRSFCCQVLNTLFLQNLVWYFFTNPCWPGLPEEVRITYNGLNTFMFILFFSPATKILQALYRCLYFDYPYFVMFHYFTIYLPDWYISTLTESYYLKSPFYTLD